MKSNIRKYRVDPREIHYIRFIVEACDGLAVVRTLDAKTGLIDIMTPPGREKESSEVINSLSREIFMDCLEPDNKET